MAKGNWGQARKEVLSLKPLILQRIEEGSSIRSIWMELSSDGRVTVALRNFDSQIKKQLGYQPGKSLSGTGRAMVVSAPTQRVLALAPRNTNQLPALDVPAAAPERDPTRIQKFVHDSTSGDFQLTPMAEPCAEDDTNTKGSKPNHED